MGNREDKKFELLKNQANLLAESFTTIQIFASVTNDEGETISYNWGDGNYNARYGQVIRWIKAEDAKELKESDD